MRLIIHLGFHKTASTFLQQLLAANLDGLAARGFWYDPEGVCGAHHPIANPLLAGDPAPFAAMIERGRAASCHTILFSSENLERSEEHTSELQSLMRISYAVFCLKKKTHKT